MSFWSVEGFLVFVGGQFTICAQFIFKGGSNDGLLQDEEDD